MSKRRKLQDGDTHVEAHPYAEAPFFRAMVYREGKLADNGKWAVFPGWHFLGDFPTRDEAEAKLESVQ